jgi:hypothetical protein
VAEPEQNITPSIAEEKAKDDAATRLSSDTASLTLKASYGKFF